jgi:dihydroxyacetone kinase
MVARRGRSAVLGERSLGTVDPGALSLLYVLEAVLPVIVKEEA